MSKKNEHEMEREVQKLWADTVHIHDDPRVTVHPLPKADAEEVETLSRALTVPQGGPQAAQPETRPQIAVTGVRHGTGDGEADERTVRLQDTVRSGLDAKGLRPKADGTRSAAGGAAMEGVEGLAGQDFFAFTERIGQGGMGVVFSARQSSLDRDVAVKTIRSEKEVTPTQLAAFLREALTTGQLSHPNIVPVHLFGRDEQGRVFMVMKRVEGRPWSALLHPEKKTRKPDEDPAESTDLLAHLEIFQKVCDAIAFAHAHQIVHRDLKPDNVMIGDYGEVMVMDWGLGLDVSGRQRRGIGASREQASTIAGTPAYMAPEMALGQIERVGPASDLYLLGAILHEIVTGRPPHAGKTVMQVLAHAACGKIDPLHFKREMPREVRELERILRKAMHDDPAQRYPNVSELQAEVRAFQAGQGARSESIALGAEAREELRELAEEVEPLRVTSPYYPRCAEVLAKAHQALTLWGHNPRAARVRQEGLALYAELALRSKDWGLAESLLRDLRLSGSGGAALAQPNEVRLRAERDVWRRRQVFFQRAYRFAAVMFFVTLGVCVYLYWQWDSTLFERNLARRDVGQLRADREQLQQSLELVQRITPKPAPLPGEVPPAGGAPDGKNAPQGKPEQAQGKTPAPAGPGPEVPIKINLPKEHVPGPRTGFAPPAHPPWRIPAAGASRARALERFAWGGAGRLLLWDGQGNAWTLRTNARSASFRAMASRHRDERVVAGAWLDERTVALADARGQVRIGDAPDRPWNLVLKTPRATPTLAGWKQGNELLLAAAAGRDLWLLSGRRGERKREERLPSPALNLRYLDDGSLMVVMEQFIDWRPPQAKMLRLSTAGLSMRQAVSARDGKSVAAVPRNAPNAILLVRRIQARWRTIFSFHRDEQVSCLALTPDGRKLAAGSTRGTLVLLETGPPPRILVQGRPILGAVKAVALSDDASRLYSLDAAGGVHAWDTSQWTK